MTRNEAIALLVQRDLAQLSREEREDMLLDWWSIDASDSEYHNLPGLLKLRLSQLDEPDDPESSLYDPLLRIALEQSYVGVINSYLQIQTKLLGSDETVMGEVEVLAACPCCGYRSLRVSKSCEICRVCFWEDDGTKDADRHSAPNHMTLREAQQNFLRIGAVTDDARRYVLPDGAIRYESITP